MVIQSLNIKSRIIQKEFTLTTTQLQPTTLRGLPSRSILHRPTHSPSFLLSSTLEKSQMVKVTTLDLSLINTEKSDFSTECPVMWVISCISDKNWVTVAISSSYSVEGAKLSSAMQQNTIATETPQHTVLQTKLGPSYLDQVDLVLSTQGFHQLDIHWLVAVGCKGAKVGLAPAIQKQAPGSTKHV